MKTKILIWLLPAWLASACDNYLNDVAPPTELTAEKVLEDDASAEAYTLGIYTNLSTVDQQLATSIGLYVDEVWPTPASGSNATEFFSSVLSPSNNTVQSLWRSLYSTIYKCNDVVDQLSRAEGLTPALRDQYVGEARFIRCYAYLLLVTLYGDVPLITAPDVASSSAAARTAAQTIMEFVIDDLAVAKELMDGGPVAAERTRPNSHAAAALLARAYLYYGNYAAAESEATTVIESGGYRLEPLDSVFVKTSRETIFQLWNENGYQLAGSFVPASGTPLYEAADDLVSTFDAADLRMEKWLGTTEVDGQVYRYLHKYRKRAPGPLTDEYTVALRLAEQYLIRAEAKLRQDRPMEAIADLEAVRLRAGLPPIAEVYPGAGTPELLELLLTERYRETFSEGAHRFADLKRFGQIDPVMKAAKSTWLATARVFPIPEAEIRINTKLEQNLGYED